MKIRSMTATFGCLDGETLCLQDGLTVLTLPNESGKSTWAAFITAMFYGVDTAQRASKGRLPEKSRYQPWNGKPMSGTMELEHQGKTIVLQRTSQRGKPMGVFRAYDKETGLALPELTGENCGMYFLGVERAVFRRSAFLSGSELAVTEDQSLSQRLENLAVSGSLQDNYPAAVSQLKLWKNRCRYHQNGLIPETETKLRKTEQTLELMEELRRERLTLTVRREALLAEADAHRQQAEAQWNETKQEAQQRLLTLLEEEAGLRSQLPAGLEKEQLHTFWEQLRLHAIRPQSKEEPDCPAALQGIDAAAILPKAQRDLAEYEVWTAVRPKPLRPWQLVAAACALLMLAALWGRLWWAAGLCAAGLAGSLYLWYRAKRHNRQVDASLVTAAALLESYGVTRKEALLPAAQRRKDWLEAEAREQRYHWSMELLMEQLRAWFPTIQTPEQALETVELAKIRLQQLEQVQQALLDAELQVKYAAIRPDTFGRSEAKQTQAAELRLQAESLRAKEEALGNWEQLESRRQRLQAELEALRQQEQALELAKEALEAAHAQLAQVYAPQLTGLAGEYLQKLTLNRYDTLILEQDWNLQVREQTTGLIRPLAALSSGTQDQVWLALRLAMTRLLLPANTPIVLDDALLTFDAGRTAAALEVLRQEPRQVLLFSCR